MLLLRKWEAGSVSSSFRMREELLMDVSILICLTNIDPSNFDIDLLASSLGLLLEWNFSLKMSCMTTGLWSWASKHFENQLVDGLPKKWRFCLLVQGL